MSGLTRGRGLPSLLYCEKNFPKSAKIEENRKKCGKLNITISVVCNNFKRLGNSEVMPSNP